MRHVLWLGLGLLWASAAHAQLHLPTPRAAPVSLVPPLELTAVASSFALTAPCLGCRPGLRSATQRYAPDPSPPVPAAQPAPRPQPKPQYALGDSWKLGGRRLLSVRLTPSPEECAPLVRLSF